MIFEKLIFKHNPNLIQFPFRYIRTILKSNSEKLYDWVVESDSVKITDFMFMEIRNDNYFSHRLYVDIGIFI